MIWKSSSQILQKGAIVLLFILLEVLPSHANCGGLFRRSPTSRTAWVNGLIVTGGDRYPVEEILRGLELDLSELPFRSDDQIASIGEGMSLLAATIRANGLPNIHSFDLVYDPAKLSRNDREQGWLLDYLGENRGTLVAADGKKLPIQTESIDGVLSHKFVNNLSIEGSVIALAEMIRVLKVDGTARVFGIREGFKDQTVAALKEVFGDAIKITLSQHKSHRILLGEKVVVYPYLFVIQKLERTEVRLI